MKDQVYIILGPTASGKTEVAIELARLTNGEVISADSMQIYRKMNIGTAKPQAAEQRGITHHMLDIVSPDEAYSVAMFQQDAKNCVKDILKRKKTPIFAGGTGLYLNSITYQLDFTEVSYDIAFRNELMKRQAGELHRMLCEQDAQAAQRIHANDKKRIIRRLEILHHGDGRTEYEFRKPNDEYQFIMAGLTMERKLLYERINLRVDKMLESGLLHEAETLYYEYGGAPASMQAIGYKELIEYFDGRLTLEQAVSLLKKNSRRYAKRQLTWFRRDERICWYDVGSFKSAAQLAENILRQESTV